MFKLNFYSSKIIISVNREEARNRRFHLIAMDAVSFDYLFILVKTHSQLFNFSFSWGEMLLSGTLSCESPCCLGNFRAPAETGYCFRSSSVHHR